jgi:hypothetical protein
MEAYAAGAGEFGAHLITRKLRAIVPDLSDFVGAWCLDIGQIERAGDWGDEDVAVLALRSAEVQMRKAENVAKAGITKARAAIIEGCHVRSQFDHAVRDSGADERVAPPIDPDEWIDVMSKILRPRSLPEHWRVYKKHDK